MTIILPPWAWLLALVIALNSAICFWQGMRFERDRQRRKPDRPLTIDDWPRPTGEVYTPKHDLDVPGWEAKP